MDRVVLNGSIWGGIAWDAQTRKRMEDDRALENYGFKVYSQNDEDGIIEEIFKRIGTTSKLFFEFGVQDGLECNSHYLLHKGWRGIWLEGSGKYCGEIAIKFRPVIKNGKLKIYHKFITRENIDGIMKETVPEGTELDFLSIDIDGNDWYIWNGMTTFQARVVCVEYNAKFPPSLDWKQAYQGRHSWDGSDWMGASLKALQLLGEKKGYKLVGTNIIGANAFFVRNDLVDEKFLESHQAEDLYNPNREKLKIYNPGHPARYCLVDQEEEKGILNYFDSINAYRRHLKKQKRERMKWNNLKGRIVNVFKGGE